MEYDTEIVICKCTYNFSNPKLIFVNNNFGANVGTILNGYVCFYWAKLPLSSVFRLPDIAFCCAVNEVEGGGGEEEAEGCG